MIIAIDLSLDDVWNLCFKNNGGSGGGGGSMEVTTPAPFEFQKIAKNKQKKNQANTEEKIETFR